MGVLGVQCRIWTFSGSVLCFRTDNNGRAYPTRFRLHGTCRRSFLDYMINKFGGNVKFFSLYGLSNTASSIIGPNVIQAIINKSGNNWDGFPFLFILCTCASLVIWFAVDVPKGRRAALRWAAERRGTVASATRSGGVDVSMSVVSSREI
jgi:Atg22-like efflux protein